MENENTEKKYKVCCVTGHRPQGFLWKYDNVNSKQHREYLAALRSCIEKLIKEGYNYFITGCAIGADLDFAEFCIELRDTAYPGIIVEGAIPCDNQDLKWSAACKERYARTIAKLDVVHYVSHKFSMGCFQKRNEYMVDRSDIVVAVWNAYNKGGTWNTIKYAREKLKKIEYILLGFYSRYFKYHEEAFRALIVAQAIPEQERLWKKIVKRMEEQEK